VADKGRHIGPQIDEEVGGLEERSHQLESLLVVVEIAGVHQSHGMEVGREDISIFIKGAVLNDIGSLFLDVEELAGASMEVVNLDIERPTAHILIETVDIGIRLCRLENRAIAIVACQYLRESGLSRAYISCNSDVHNMSKFAYPFVIQKNRHNIILFLKKQIYKKNPSHTNFFVK
jgi:hypothetical protein